jgi:flagellar M-ring protein FliF
MNLKEIWERIKKFYNEKFKPLTLNQKILWISLIFGAIVAISVLTYINSIPHYVVLVSNLSESNAGDIANELNKLGIPYQAGKNGTIYIPESQNVYDVRMKLATAGLLGPTAGVQGYSLLTNNSLSSLGMTSFDRQVQYQIALAGELEGSIDMLQEIEYSKVFLSLPKYTYYVPGQEEKPTASVLVVLKPNMQLSQDQILGIANLVAGAVGDMALSDVKIVDQYSNVLSNEIDLSQNAMVATSKFKLQQMVENYYVDKVKGMLYNVFGYGNVAVSANAVLDWQKITQEDKTYVPEDQKNNTGVISNQEVQTNVSSNGAPSGAVGGSSNIPPTYVSTSPASELSSYSNTITNYNVSEVYKSIVNDKSGDLQNLTMTVFLNSTNTAVIPTIKAAVAKAVGASSSSIDVLAMPFNRSAEQTAEEAMTQAQNQARFRTILTYSIILVILLTASIFYFSFQIRKRKQVKAVQIRRKKIEEEVAQVAQKVEAEPQNKEFSQLQGNVSEWVDRDPEDVAQIIKLWMNKE